MEKTEKAVDKRERIVKRVARELRDGFYVNLGIGMPMPRLTDQPSGMSCATRIANSSRPSGCQF